MQAITLKPTEPDTVAKTPIGWFVYMILDTNQCLYTGITTDMARRWREHSHGKAGARYFRGRQPAFLCLLESQPNRRDASKREYAIKCLSRRAKLTLIKQCEAHTQRIVSQFQWDSIPRPDILSPPWI